MEFDLPPNPFLKHGTAQKHFLLLRKTETEMDVAIRVTQSGFPYADAAEMLQIWEYKQVNPQSKHVGLRISWKMDWINRPWMLDKLLVSLAHDKLLEAVDFYRGFQQR